MESTRDWALRYAALDLPVMPLHGIEGTWPALQLQQARLLQPGQAPDPVARPS